MKKKYMKPYIKEVKLISRHRLLVGSEKEPEDAKRYGGEFG